MIAVDANLLVYAHRGEAHWYRKAYELLRDLAESHAPWAIPYPCIHEFLRNVTDPRIYATPTTLEAALDQVTIWTEAPSLRLLAEGRGHLDRFVDISLARGIRGAMIHDARIAAICLEHDVSELWTADRDFGRFPTLKTRNPLVG
ncbi:MAG TPA: TA system VapC family ribonuclease toxin [Conexibacter sp.]|nr:TA system VapC family ribonuclease toxin [Conexibacter sp.]